MEVLQVGPRTPRISSRPPLSTRPIPFMSYTPELENFLVVDQEVQTMLNNNALEVVDDQSPRFVSRIFLVEKATGRWRRVIVFSHWTSFVLRTKFRMKTLASLMVSIKENDFMSSTALEDAYVQIHIHQDSRNYLRFVWGCVWCISSRPCALNCQPHPIGSPGPLPRCQLGHSRGICLSG